MNLLIELIKEYQRLLELRVAFEKWEEEHPEFYSNDRPYQYNGEYISLERLKRTGLMIRQTMIDVEKVTR